MTNVPGLPAMDDPDIVRVILERVAILVPEGDRAKLGELEQQVRTEYGGLRVRIPKRGKYLSDQDKRRLVQEAMNSPAETNESLAKKSGVSRRTWYYMIKQGPTSRGG